MGGGERPRWGCNCKVLSPKRLLAIVIRCSGLERRAMVKRGKLRTELGGGILECFGNRKGVDVAAARRLLLWSKALDGEVRV